MSEAAIPFVDWDPCFSPEGDASSDGPDGLIWLYDAEGEPLVRVLPKLADVVAAALEYAYADIAAIYGVGWRNLSNDQVATLLRRHRGEHRHVGLASVEE